jgi:hypothetical protein
MNEVAVWIGEVMPAGDENKIPEVVTQVLNSAETGKNLTAEQELQGKYSASASQNIADNSNQLSHSDFREDPWYLRIHSK